MISITKINDMLNRLERFGAAVAAKLTDVGKRLNENAAAIRKLQRMTPDDIGLGQVRNYAPSTTDQAKKAVNNTSNMTPRRTRDYAEENVFGPIGEAFKAAAARLP